MRWMVTGGAGMLGRDVVGALEAAGHGEVTAYDRAGLDVTDAGAVLDAVAGHDVVINTAAWTDVDAAETHERQATAVNGDGVRHLATACAKHGVRFLHVSTDYVFAGDATRPYAVDAPTAPINAYGRSKLAGERAVAELLPDTGHIVRTAWLYGEHGPNFVATMLNLAARRETLAVVDDQRGQPTWSLALAGRLVELGVRSLDGRAPAGIYHGTAAGTATWFDLARAVFETCGLDPERVRPTTSQAFVRPAPRPSYSVMSHERWAAAGLDALPQWRTLLSAALDRPGFQALRPDNPMTGVS